MNLEEIRNKFNEMAVEIAVDKSQLKKLEKALKNTYGLSIENSEQRLEVIHRQIKKYKNKNAKLREKVEEMLEELENERSKE